MKRDEEQAAHNEVAGDGGVGPACALAGGGEEGHACAHEEEEAGRGEMGDCPGEEVERGRVEGGGDKPEFVADVALSDKVVGVIERHDHHDQAAQGVNCRDPVSRMGFRLLRWRWTAHRW